jgi:drug/metabolite transporter (DMT)-like permease
MIFAYFIAIAWGFSYYLSSKITRLGLSYAGFSMILFPINFLIIAFGYFNKDLHNDIKIISNGNYILMLSFILFNVLGNFLVFMSMKEVNPFVISILELGYPIIIFLIMFFNNEIKFSFNNIIGIILTMFGIFLILYDME